MKLIKLFHDEVDLLLVYLCFTRKKNVSAQACINLVHIKPKIRQVVLFSFKCHCLDSCSKARHCCNLKWSQATNYWLEIFHCIESSFSRWIHLIVCLYCGVSSTLLQSCKAMAAMFPITAIGKIPYDEAKIPYRCMCLCTKHHMCCMSSTLLPRPWSRSFSDLSSASDKTSNGQSCVGSTDGYW